MQGTYPRTKIGARTKMKIKHVLRHDKDCLGQLEDLLDPKMSYSLLDMSRIPQKNRHKDEDFDIMLKPKLRLPLWPEERSTCWCDKVVDMYGDRVLSCRIAKRLRITVFETALLYC